MKWYVQSSGILFSNFNVLQIPGNLIKNADSDPVGQESVLRLHISTNNWGYVAADLPMKFE